MKNSHAIRTVRFDLSFGESLAAKEFVDRIGSFFQFEVLPALEEIFDRQSPETFQLFIDQLAIDLGPVEEAKLYETLRIEIPKRLDKFLESLIWGEPVDSSWKKVPLLASIPPEGIFRYHDPTEAFQDIAYSVEKKEELTLSLLRIFLQTGTLPSNAPLDRDYLGKLFEQALETQPDQLRDLILELPSETRLKRLAWNLSAGQRKTVEELTGISLPPASPASLVPTPPDEPAARQSEPSPASPVISAPEREAPVAGFVPPAKQETPEAPQTPTTPASTPPPATQPPAPEPAGKDATPPPDREKPLLQEPPEQRAKEEQAKEEKEELRKTLEKTISEPPPETRPEEPQEPAPVSQKEQEPQKDEPPAKPESPEETPRIPQKKELAPDVKASPPTQAESPQEAMPVSEKEPVSQKEPAPEGKDRPQAPEEPAALVPEEEAGPESRKTTVETPPESGTSLPVAPESPTEEAPPEEVQERTAIPGTDPGQATPVVADDAVRIPPDETSPEAPSPEESPATPPLPPPLPEPGAEGPPPAALQTLEMAQLSRRELLGLVVTFLETGEAPVRYQNLEAGIGELLEAIQILWRAKPAPFAEAILPFIAPRLKGKPGYAEILAQIQSELEKTPERNSSKALIQLAKKLRGPARPQVVPEETDFEKIVDEESFFIKNAGLILVWPFMRHLFNALKLLDEKGQFLGEEQKVFAAHVLEYVATRNTITPEYLMTLNKILCEIPFATPIPAEVDLEPEVRDLIESMLRAIIKQWTALKATSEDGLRGNFLIREGKLVKKEKNWTLVVEQKAYDLLLDRLPWSISTVKLPWMTPILFVEWR